MATELTIGRLAEEAGVNVETIRYYQRRGLMDEPIKPANGHRSYAPDAVKRVRFIKRAQVLGFTLEEVGSLLELEEVRACVETRELAAHKLQVVEQKLTDLKAMRKALKTLVAQCDTGQPRAVARSSRRWRQTELASALTEWHQVSTKRPGDNSVFCHAPKPTAM